MPDGSFNIGGIDFTNDRTGIRRTDNQPFFNANSWGEANQELLGGNTDVLFPELRPYADQFSKLNSDIASTEHYDSAGLGEALGAFGLVMGAGTGLSGLLGGTALTGALPFGESAVLAGEGSGIAADSIFAPGATPGVGGWGPGESVTGGVVGSSLGETALTSDVGEPTGPSMITPTGPMALSPETAAALGIDMSSAVPFGESALLSGEGGFGGTASGMVPGGAPFETGAFDMGQFSPADVGLGGAKEATDPLKLKAITDTLKKLGISPSTAAMLGISGVQALTKPQIPGAAKTLEANATPGAAAANATIQSGGTNTPAWAGQKASIDATVDQQIQQQIQAMLQQAQNSGQGADSQVTQQQINKIKTQLETQRQNLYAQAQAQNVQAALTALGINNQALSTVASTQYQESNQAKNAASETAKNALMLEALSKKVP